MLASKLSKIEDDYGKYEKRKFDLEKGKMFSGTVFNNPLVFMLNCCPNYLFTIEMWQLDVILSAFFDLNLPRTKEEIAKIDPNNASTLRIAMCGGRNTGKTFILSILILWLLFIGRSCNTSSFKAYSGKEEQLKTVLLSKLYEIGENEKTLFPQMFFKRKDTRSSLKFYSKSHNHATSPLPNDPYVSCETWSLGNVESLAGTHFDLNVIVVDEAQAVHDDCFVKWEGIFASGISIMILTGNGTKPEATFSKFIKSDRWRSFSISVDECKRISEAKKEEIMQSCEFYGQDFVNVYYYGLIGKGDSDTFFDIECLESCLRKPKDEAVFFSGVKPILGIDIGLGKGGDYTVIVKKQGKNIEILEYTNHTPPTYITEIIKQIYFNMDGNVDIAIDSDGIGATVAYDLQSQNIDVLCVHGGQKVSKAFDVKGNVFNSKGDSMFKNMKSMLYDRTRKWINRCDTSIKSKCGTEVLRKIREEAPSVKFTFDCGLSVADKKQMATSPDIFDAIAYSFLRGE